MESSSVYGYKPQARRTNEETDAVEQRNGGRFGDMTPKLTDADLELAARPLRPPLATTSERRGFSPLIAVVGVVAIVGLLLLGLRELSTIMQDGSPTPAGLPQIFAETETTTPEFVVAETTPTASATQVPTRTPSPTQTRTATETNTRVPTQTVSPIRSATATRTVRPSRTPSPTPVRPKTTRTVSNYLQTATGQAEVRATMTRMIATQAAGALPTSQSSGVATQAGQVAQPTSGGSSGGVSTSVPQLQPTSVPPTAVPPTFAPPTSIPPTPVPPTPVPPTSVPPTSVPPTNTPVINLPLPTIPLVQTLLPGLLGKAP